MSKYLWVDDDFFKWTTEQTKRMKENSGINLSTRTVTNLLHREVIVPNNIQMEKVLKPLIIRQWGKNRLP